MKTIYPYDPDANLPSNRVTAEVDVNLYPNKFNVVVPEAAPFYRLDLEVRDSDERLLIEGLDYYLAYYSKEISEATGKPVYGGIMLFDAKNANVKLRTVGGNHMIPPSEIARFLTDPEITEPRNVNWSELQRYPTAVTPVDKPDSLPEALEKDVVVKALDGVRQNILAKIGDLDAKYDALIASIGAVADKIGDHELWIHHKVPHQHNYTRADLNALGVDETAVDAIKAYGLTLQELVDEMVTFGINQSRIDDLINDTLDRTIKGRFNVDPAKDLILQHESGNAKLKLDNGSFEMETAAGEIVFEADTDSNQAGIGLEIGAGYNVLLVPSHGGTRGDYPSFNGKILITVDNILNFLHKPAQATANVQTQSTETLEFQGRGVDSSPIKAQAVPPIATTSVTGLWKITDSLLMTGPGYGISQWAVTVIRNALDGYIPKAFTINGMAFGSGESITLTKAHIGLSAAENTSPSEKPVTTALTNATKNKALQNHTHGKGDLTGVPIADHDTEGLASLHNTIDDTTNKAATPKAGNDLKGLIDDVEEDVAGRVKAGAASATHYGGDGYLPVPMLGNYGHANYSYPAFYGEEDRNMKWTILVNLASDFGRGVFYHELQLSEAGAIVYHNKTSVEYLPPFLAELGRNARYVFGGLDGLFHIQDDAGQNWLVQSMGTMDMSKHRACKLPSTSRDYRYTIHGDYIYRVHAYTGMNDYVHVVRAPLSALLTGGEITTWETVDLTGNDIYGNRITGSVKFAPIDMSEDPNAQSLIWRNDGGKWSHIGPRHSAQNWDMILDGDTLVVYTYQRAYCSNSYTSSYGPSDQTTCTKINMRTKQFVIQQPEKMKQTLDESGIVSQETANLNRWPGVEPNNSSMRLFGKKFSICGRWYGMHSSMSVYVCTIPEGVTRQQLCERKTYGYSHKSSGTVNGPTPSVINSVRSMPSWMNNREIVYRDLNTGFNICEINPDVPYPGDNGLGPTTNRRSYANQHHLSRIPRDWRTGQEKNQGYTGIPGERKYTRSDDSGNFFDERVWSNSNTNAMLERMKAKAIADGRFQSDWFIHHQIFLTVFGDPSNPIRAFVVYAARHYRSASKNNQGHTALIYEVSVSVSGDTITAANEQYIQGWLVNGSTTGVGTSIGETPQSMTYLSEEGVRGFYLANNPVNSHVGNSGRPDFYLQDVAGGGYRSTTKMVYSYRFNDILGWHPKFGAYYYDQTSSADAIVGYVAGRKADDIWNRVNKEKVYILASTAEEGWIIYFTQDMPFYANQTLYNVPAANFDLRALYPGNHANRKFFIHVDVTDGTPKYTIDEARKPDTDTRLWIGHAVTDDSRIIELEAERARRLGSIATLLQHEHNKYAHRYDYSDTLLSSEYSLLENKGMVHDFNVVSFKDIFDSWYRFSHNSTGTYPANAGETTQWSYVEQYDCVQSTVNSSTFIGFISDEMAGDYVFNTVVSSYNGDDDGIFVILGAFKQGDIDSKEHTLALQVNTGGFGTATPHVCLIKDHLQAGQERIATLDPTSDGHTANTGWMEAGYYEVFHIWAKREKNQLVVYVKREQIATSSNSSADYDYKVSNYVKSVRNLREADFEAQQYFKAEINLTEQVPMFARPSRFGYGAQSQHAARFWNIERPLSNLNEFYSSEQMLLESMAKADGAYQKFSGQTTKASVGNKYSGTNFMWKGWGNAVEHSYAGSTSGNYARPHPTAKYVAPTRVYNPPGNRTFMLKKEIVITTGGIRIVGTADDELRLYVDSTDHGVVGTATQTSKEIAVSPGPHTFTFVCKNIPANSPAFCAFAIYNDGALIDVSDTSWKCFDDTGNYDNIKVAQVSYLIEPNVEDVFAVQAKTAAKGVAPREISDPVYEPATGGKRRVKRYVDVTKGDVTWDVTMIKNPV